MTAPDVDPAILAAMKAAREQFDADADGYTLKPVPAWLVFNYREAARVAQRIRDEAVAAERANYEGAMADLAARRDQLQAIVGGVERTLSTNAALPDPDVEVSLLALVAERDALVEEARAAADAAWHSANATVAELRDFLDANYPKEADRG